MKRHILLFALLLCSAGRIGAQDSGSNWIKTRTAISETGTAITDITYYNGLGLPSQTANVRASVNGYNIVTPVAYDALLRSDATAYLPYEATYSDETELPNSTAVSEQQTFYEERYGYDYERSFTEKIYETSPLGRVRKQALPGYMKDFEVLYTEFDYRTNDTDEMRRLSVSGSGELVCEGCHDAGTLSCSVTTDPDGHVVQSFTDGQGRTLLNRTFDGDEPIDTYSVYDDAGRLRWVVTPEGSYLLGDSQTFAANDDFAEKYCYIYTYDDRGRMIEKQLPGREPEYMVYDLGDRLIMSQDGNLRAQDQWIVYCYDDFGRLTEQLTEDRIGLIVFAGDAYMQLPITSDYVIARSFANSISPDMVSRQGTAIGAAINLAMNSFSSGSEGSRVLILISDGENHEDDALAAAAAAAAQGIKIYTIGIGTPEGAPISIGGEFIKDEQGNMVVSKLDEKTLQQIAVSTGGSYIRATNRSLGLNEIVKQINEVEKKELKTKVFEDFDEQFRGLLWAALGLLLIEGAMLTRKNRILARFSVFKSSDHDLR